MPRTIPIAERFWRNVRQTNDASCWIWLGKFTSAGYGKIWFNGRTASAHRVSWILAFGDIPDHLFVLHHCDNKACVRPDHLFLGTQTDNIADKLSKHREARGPKTINKHPNPQSGPDHWTHRHPEQVRRGYRSPSSQGTKHHGAKLTDSQVREIRALRSSGVKLRVLAARFGISEAVVSKIAKRHLWSHVI